jgi:hypothetical protein
MVGKHLFIPRVRGPTPGSSNPTNAAESKNGLLIKTLLINTKTKISCCFICSLITHHTALMTITMWKILYQYSLFWFGFVSAWSTTFHDKKSQENDLLFLAGLDSSPERYAKALNMTVQQVADRKVEHRLASMALQLQIKEVYDGTERHRLICEHRIRYGQHPFVCPECWSYVPVCVCHHLASEVKARTTELNCGSNQPLTSKINSKLEVVVWIHHKEWGLTSNTGGLLRLALGTKACTLFMKELPKHDNQLQRLYFDQHLIDKLLVVLWP